MTEYGPWLTFLETNNDSRDLSGFSSSCLFFFRHHHHHRHRHQAKFISFVSDDFPRKEVPPSFPRFHIWSKHIRYHQIPPNITKYNQNTNKSEICLEEENNSRRQKAIFDTIWRNIPSCKEWLAHTKAISLSYAHHQTVPQFNLSKVVLLNVNIALRVIHPYFSGAE